MSQESIINECKQPKKFLKKGEGLKRFAAFKPPLPVTGRKSERRQTFVKFKLDNNIYSKILDDDSINLSTEIPKIPPPKIMHTPIRPRTHIHGALRPIPFNVPEDSMEQQFATPPHSLSPPLPALAKHQKLTKSQTLVDSAVSLKTNTTATTRQKSARHREQSEQGNNVETKRYNLRGSRKQTPESNSTQQPKDAKKTIGRARKIKAVVERHVGGPVATGDHPNQDEAAEDQAISESAINGELDHLLKKIENRKSSYGRQEEANDIEGVEDTAQQPATNSDTPIIAQKYTIASDLSTPTPGNYLLALSRKIEQIEATVNELKDRVKNCECGALMSTPKQAPTTRATRKATTCTNQNKQTNATNSTPDLMRHLVKIVEELKLQELKRLDEVDRRYE